MSNYDMSTVSPSKGGKGVSPWNPNHVNVNSLRLNTQGNQSTSK